MPCDKHSNDWTNLHHFFGDLIAGKHGAVSQNHLDLPQTILYNSNHHKVAFIIVLHDQLNISKNPENNFKKTSAASPGFRR